MLLKLGGKGGKAKVEEYKTSKGLCCGNQLNRKLIKITDKEINWKRN